jgi:hypothetical protein
MKARIVADHRQRVAALRERLRTTPSHVFNPMADPLPRSLADIYAAYGHDEDLLDMLIG